MASNADFQTDWSLVSLFHQPGFLLVSFFSDFILWTHARASSLLRSSRDRGAQQGSFLPVALHPEPGAGGSFCCVRVETQPLLGGKCEQTDPRHTLSALPSREQLSPPPARPRVPDITGFGSRLHHARSVTLCFGFYVCENGPKSLSSPRPCSQSKSPYRSDDEFS